MTGTGTQQMRSLVATAASALSQFRRVRLNSTLNWVYAGASDTDAVGCLSRDALDTVTPITVEPFINSQMVAQTMIAAGAITAPAAVYAAANGMVAATGTVLAGLAVTSTTTSGDTVVVIPSAAAILGAIARTALTTDSQPYTVPLTGMKTHATLVALGSAAGTPAGDMGLTPGTHGTNTPILIGEAANANSKSDAARFEFELPAEYVAGGTITIQVTAQITGNVQVAQTVAVQAYASDTHGGVSSALVAGGAQAVTTSWAVYSFTVTPTSRVAGDVLDCLITAAANDTGGTANKLIQIGDVRVVLQVKG